MTWSFAERSGELTISDFDKANTGGLRFGGEMTAPGAGSSVYKNQFSGSISGSGMTGSATGSFVNNGNRRCGRSDGQLGGDGRQLSSLGRVRWRRNSQGWSLNWLEQIYTPNSGPRYRHVDQKSKGHRLFEGSAPRAIPPSQSPESSLVSEQGLRPGLADNIDDQDAGQITDQTTSWRNSARDLRTRHIDKSAPKFETAGRQWLCPDTVGTTACRDRCRIVHDVGRLSLCKTCHGILHRSDGGIGATDKFSCVIHSAIRSRARAIRYLTSPSTTAI